MGRLPFASGSGQPDAPQLTDEQFADLGAEFRKPLADGWKRATQSIIDEHVDWYWCQFAASTAPMHEFYEDVASRYEELARLLKRGPSTTDAEVIRYTRSLFDQQARKARDDTFAKLPYRLEFAAASFRAAHRHLREIELPSSKPGPKVDERMDRLVWRLADMVEAHGGKATAPKDGMKEKHNSPFLRFTNRVYELLPDDARAAPGNSKSGPIASTVRRVLETRREMKKNDQS